jgi:hypothetical protein
MDQTPNQYDPDLTEQLLEEGGKRLNESRRILDELDARLDDDRGG